MTHINRVKGAALSMHLASGLAREGLNLVRAGHGADVSGV